LTPDLASFSQWTLALLPRLFLYPGGLWLLGALLLLRYTWTMGEGRRSLRVEVAELDLLPAAAAWGAISLMPLPGAAVLPFPVDRLALTALLAFSLLAGSKRSDGLVRLEAVASGAIMMALMVPVGMEGSLLVLSFGSGWLVVLQVLGAMLGLLALAWMGQQGIAARLRWVGWLLMGLQPLFGALPSDGGILWISLLAGAGILVASPFSRAAVPQRERTAWWAASIGWLPVLAALLFAIVGPR
jgi:hypothetical protein